MQSMPGCATSVPPQPFTEVLSHAKLGTRQNPYRCQATEEPTRDLLWGSGRDSYFLVIREEIGAIKPIKDSSDTLIINHHSVHIGNRQCDTSLVAYIRYLRVSQFPPSCIEARKQQSSSN